jgi:hypothetical protein
MRDRLAWQAVTWLFASWSAFIVIREIWRLCKHGLSIAPYFVFRAAISQCRKIWCNVEEEMTALNRPNLEYAEFENDDEIRVLSILPGNGTSVLYCQLETVTLDDNLDFVAASYTWSRHHFWPGILAAFFTVWLSVFVMPTLLVLQLLWPKRFKIQRSDSADKLYVRWGDQVLKFLTRKERQHVIVCNGKTVRVGKNLYAFLRQLRQNPERHSRYWIDAICINQQDVKERNQQILLMPKIYTTACRVLAWLGPCPRFLDDTRIGVAVGTPRSDLSDNNWEAVLLPKIVRWYLLSRPYFMRVWIVQEVLLAKRLDFLMGSHQLSPDEIHQMIELNARARPVLPGLPRILSERIVSAKDLLASRSRYRRGAGWSLADHLISTVGRVATDPRDLVYAGLGLLGGLRPEVTNPETATIVTCPEKYNLSLLDRPDYSADFRDVFFHCGIKLLQNEGLGALSFGYDGLPPEHLLCTSLPSWVPQFSTLSSHSLLVAAKNRKYTAGGSCQPRVIVTPSKSLRLESGALLLDAVEVIFETGTNTMYNLLLQTLDSGDVEYLSTGERHLDALARTLMADCFRGDRLEPRSATAQLTEFLRTRLRVAIRRIAYDDRLVDDMVNDVTPWSFATILRLGSHWSNVHHLRLADLVEKLEASQISGHSNEHDPQRPYDETHPRSSPGNSCAPAEELDSPGTTPPKIPHPQTFRDGRPLSLSTFETFDNLDQYLNPDPGPYDIELEDKLRHHAFFKTKNGRIGIGSPYLQKDDVIMVLAGAAVPYAGRRLDPIKPTPTFKLVGEVYVHGIMDGELVDTDLWRPEVISIR